MLRLNCGHHWDIIDWSVCFLNCYLNNVFLVFIAWITFYFTSATLGCTFYLHPFSASTHLLVCAELYSSSQNQEWVKCMYLYKSILKICNTFYVSFVEIGLKWGYFQMCLILKPCCCPCVKLTHTGLDWLDGSRRVKVSAEYHKSQVLC